MSEPKKLTLMLCAGVEGQCVYLNNHRIAGPKPWGGGRTVKEWQVDLAQVLQAIGVPARAALTPEDQCAWKRCHIGSCKRHEDCMYMPCRAALEG